MKKSMRLLTGLAVTWVLAVLGTTTKAMAPIHGNELQACIEACQSLLGEPIYQLKKCVAHCQSRYAPIPRETCEQAHEQDSVSDEFF